MALSKNVGVQVNTRGTVGASGASTQATVTAYAALINIIQREANVIMKEAADIILIEAKNNIHNDTGALAASGRIVLQKTGKGTRAAVIFGGEDFPVSPTRNTRGGVNGDGVVDYAFFVHEGISPTGRGSSSGVKYLERAVMSTQSQVKDFIVKKLRTATKLKSPRR